MPSPTIAQVLANSAQYPPELVSAAKNFSETKAFYAAKAAEQARQLVVNADALTVDAGEQKSAFGAIVDMKEAVNTRADSAFAIIAADFVVVDSAPVLSPPPPPPAPTPEPAPAPAPV